MMPGAGAVATAVLAAGASRRFGAVKQLAPWDGEPLVRRATRAALDAGLGPVFVVTGHAGADVAAAVAGLGARIVANADWAEGMAASIRAAVSAARAADGVRALILMACDQPGVSAATLRRLVADAPALDKARVACRYAGAAGIPALFGSAWFDALGQLTGDHGARPVLEAPGAAVRTVGCPEGAADVDTRDDMSPGV